MQTYIHMESGIHFEYIIYVWDPLQSVDTGYVLENNILLRHQGNYYSQALISVTMVSRLSEELSTSEIIDQKNLG